MLLRRTSTKSNAPASSKLGKLLVEANKQCERGKWLDWLYEEFDWAVSTAENYMNVARLAAQFPKFGNLKVPATVLYAIASLDKAAVPDAIARLEAATKKGRVALKQGRKLVRLVELRHAHGDFPDATLSALGSPALDAETRKALKAKKPKTEAAANQIIEKLFQDRVSKHIKQSPEEAEAEAILDGPPPKLPPQETKTPEPVRFGNDTGEGNAWIEDFDSAVLTLDKMRSKKLSTFSDTSAKPDQIKAIADFLNDVAAWLSKQKVAA